MNRTFESQAQRQRSNLFDLLKKVLKARGITYMEVARLLEVSEPTVKRLFQEQDCKLSRLVELCDLLGMSIADLVEMGERDDRSVTTLTPEVEAQLANDAGLMSFFMLLVNHYSVASICDLNELPPADAVHYLQDLERLGLIQLGRGNQVHFNVARPIRWNENGPLHKALEKVNCQFMSQAMNEHTGAGYPFFSSNRLLSEASIHRLNLQLDALYEQYQKQANLDQLHFASHQLKPYQLLGTIAPIDIPRYFKVPRYTR